MKKELKDMQVGDVLVDEDGEAPSVVQLVMPDCFIHYMEGYDVMITSFERAEKYGWKLKDQSAPKKLTKAKIEEKLGYSIEIVEERDEPHQKAELSKLQEEK